MIRAASGAMGVNLAGAGLSFASAALLSRALGPENFGVYSVFYGVSLVLLTVIGCGMQGMVIREVAVALAKGEHRLIRGLRLRSRQALLAMGALAGTVMWLLSGLLFPGLGDTVRGLAALAALLALLSAAGELQSAFLQGAGRVVEGRLVAVLRPGFLCLGLGAALLGANAAGWRLDPAGALALHGGAALLALLALGAMARRALRRIDDGATGDIHDRPRDWARSAFPMLFARLAQMLNQEMPILVLGAFAAAEQAGLYRVAERTAFFLGFGMMAAAMVARPALARHWHDGDLAALQARLRMAAKLVLAFTLPALVGLALLGPWLIGAAFGAAYDPATVRPVLYVLLAGQAVNALSGITGALMNMTRREWVGAAAQAGAAAVNLALCLALVADRGALGGALASAAALAAFNLALVIYAVRALNVSPTLFWPAPRRPRAKPLRKAPWR